MHVVAIVMWLLLAFGTISGLAFWLGERRRLIRERAYRDVLAEKGMLKPGEPVEEAIARALRPSSNRPKRSADSLRPSEKTPSSRAPGPPPLPSFNALHREGQ